MTEHNTQLAIIDLIKWRGGVATRVNSGSITKTVGEKTYRVKLADKDTADIIGLYKGIYLAIEVKHGKNKATPVQVEFLESVASAGGVGLVAYDIDVVEKLLDAIVVYGDKFHIYVVVEKPNQLFIGG